MTDAEKNPVEGARVHVLVPRSCQIEWCGPRLLSWKEVGDAEEPLFELAFERLAGCSVTGAEGRFELKGLPPLWDGRVCVYHPEYLPAILRTEALTRRGKEVDLGDVVLKSGHAVQGTVQVKDGSGISGALVGVQRVETGSAKGYRPRPPGDVPPGGKDTLHAPRPRALGDIRAVRADEKGAYRLSGLAAGRYVIAAWSKQHPPVEHVIEVGPEEETLERDFALAPGEALTVKVTYTHDGKPFPGAVVRIRRWTDRGNVWSWENEEPVIASAVTGHDGKVAFPALTPGPYLVTAIPPDRKDDRIHTPIGFSATAKFETGKEAHLALEPLAPVRGKVLDDETGIEIPLFHASLRDVWQKDAPSRASRNRADLERRDLRAGRFSFEDARPGPWTLEIRAKGYLPAVADLDIPVEGLEDEIVVRLRRGTERASGLVLDDATGRPLEGVKVLLYEQFSRSMWGNRSETRTDGEGRFTLENLLGRSDYRWIAFTKQGYVTKKLKRDATKPIPETFETVRLVKAGVIKGVMVDASGDPVEGYVVWARPVKGSAKGAPEVRTGSDGRFVIENLAPGPYRVRGHEEVVEVKAGETVEIRCVQGRGR